MKKILVLLLFVYSLCQSVYAQDPETGWWWNTTESGRGFAIEKQGKKIFFAAFLYDNSSFPTWYTAILDKQGKKFVGTLQQFKGGQTLLGTYQAPETLDGNAGDITLKFTDKNNGVLTWPTGRTVITRFVFASDDGSADDFGNDNNDSRRDNDDSRDRNDDSGRDNDNSRDRNDDFGHDNDDSRDRNDDN
jgi:hypothetical protein